MLKFQNIVMIRHWRRVLPVFLALCLSIPVGAQERVIDVWDGPLTDPFELMKTVSNFDRAVAFMDAGKMQVNGVENFGMLSGRWRPRSHHGVWGDLRWIVPVITMPPGPWGANITTEDGAVEDRSGQYNTIESVTGRLVREGDGSSITDWEAKDGARDHFHGSAATSGGTPLIAVSTQENSWPQGYYDENDKWVSTPGESQWPGGWALDPDASSPTYGQEIPGVFTSSKDIYFIADDKYSGIRSAAVNQKYGYPVGLDLEVTGYSYANPRYEDVVFFNMNFIFRTSEELNDPNSRNYDPNRNHYDGTIDSVYFAFFVDPDLPGDYISLQENATPWAEDDYADVLDVDGDGKLDVFITFDKKGEFKDSDGSQAEGPVSAYGIHFFKTPLVDPSDPASGQLGITGMHWFDQDVAFIPHDVNAGWEQVIYALSAGRPDLMPAGEPVDWWFHGDDPNFDDLDMLRDFQESFAEGSRPDVMFWFSSGPFSMSPGDTIPIHIGIVGGDTDPGTLDTDGFWTNPPEIHFADLYENLALAQELYDNKFQGSGPPRAPKLKAVGTDTLDRNDLPVTFGESGQVTLYWDNAAEISRDIITKVQDFEGYKIYKSMFDPDADNADWGTPIYDYDGETIVGWKTTAQFDLDNEFEGADPYNPFFHLGDNTGIQHVLIDKDVINGVRYRYAITSYDHGDTAQFMAALESILGNDVRQSNIVDVIPGVRPEGYIAPEADSLLPPTAHLEGFATGSLYVEIIDPIAMEDAEYEVTFVDTGSDLLFNVDNVTTGRNVVSGSPVVWREDQAGVAEAVPIFDGIGVKIINHDVAEMLEASWQPTSGDTSEYILDSWSVAPGGIATQEDHLIVFGDSTHKFYADPTSEKVPFQIFNITNDAELDTPLLLFSSGRRLPWYSGESFIISQPADPRPYKTWGFSIITEVYDTSVTPIDTIPLASPAAGDRMLVRIKKELTGDDVYRFTTTAHSADTEVTAEDLDLIRVVPNPYVVYSVTELSTGSIYRQKEIRFTHLPEKCTIRIYTARGDLIRTLEHESSSIGELVWDLVTKENLDIAYGVYIYVVEARNGKKKVGKFAVIK